jgi:hypothetical protein
MVVQAQTYPLADKPGMASEGTQTELSSKAKHRMALGAAAAKARAERERRRRLADEAGSSRFLANTAFRRLYGKPAFHAAYG